MRLDRLARESKLFDLAMRSRQRIEQNFLFNGNEDF